MILHKSNEQPRDTIGKLVAYVTEDFTLTPGIYVEGHMHMPYSADQLNWRRRSEGVKVAPTLGRIHSYMIIDTIPARRR